jgi:hypothetical protein
MQYALALLLLLGLAAPACAAVIPGAYESTLQLAQSGAAQLALSRVERQQPRDPAAAQWGDWEALRCRLLGRLERHKEVIERAAMLTTPSAAGAVCHAEAARSALADRQPAVARAHAARLIWQQKSAPAEIQAVRLLVIESYVMEKRGEEAYRSMLRYQQDFPPLGKATAARFVEALLGLDLDKEAVTWLPQLDEASPEKLALRARAGLASPEAAVAQARAAIAKGGGAGYWRAIADVARRQRSATLEIEALEQLLQAADPRGPDSRRAARELWQAYSAAALDVANRQRLLVGDDAGWADFAARRAGPEPAAARALFAHLAQRAQSADARHTAQLQLAASLRSARLDLAALALYEEAFPDAGALDAQSRHLLGALAENRNRPASALRYWQGLAAPADMTTEDWLLRVARVAMGAGKTDVAAAGARQSLAGGKAPPERVQQAAALAQELQDAGKRELADGLFEQILAVADAAQARTVLYGQARIHDQNGQAAAAAEYYLRSALLAETRPPDSLALQARLQAGLNLARAGYKADARAQFEWLLQNSRDPAQLEVARRELKKL